MEEEEEGESASPPPPPPSGYLLEDTFSGYLEDDEREGFDAAVSWSNSLRAVEYSPAVLQA